MHLWDDLMTGYRAIVEKRPARSVGARHLTEDDYDSFMAATEVPRDLEPLTVVRRRPRSHTSAFVTHMNRYYPLRMRRLRRDFKWLQKQARKNNIEPEDVRWML